MRSALAANDWLTGLACLSIDAVSWILIYGLISYLRRDQFFVGPFEFVLVDVIQVAVICQALFMIGGYDRNNDKRALTYTAEHILAIIGAATVSALLVYSAAAYDSSIKPSRGVLLISFAVFLPWSIAYRRAIHRFVAESTAGRAFLVIGSGELAARFYEAYRQSGNRQRLEFVDIERERVGEHIAGNSSPIIEGDLATKLANLSDRYSGVVLAERVDRIRPELLEHLVRTQFQRTRVYTLESFYEAHWRHVPVHALDPFWPLQMGFQLSRNSPYHYLKRLFDIALSRRVIGDFVSVTGANRDAPSGWEADGRSCFANHALAGKGRCLPFSSIGRCGTAPRARSYRLMVLSYRERKGKNAKRTFTLERTIRESPG